MFRVKIEQEAKDNLRTHYLNIRHQSQDPGELK